MMEAPLSTKMAREERRTKRLRRQMRLGSTERGQSLADTTGVRQLVESRTFITNPMRLLSIARRHGFIRSPLEVGAEAFLSSWSDEDAI